MKPKPPWETRKGDINVKGILRDMRKQESQHIWTNRNQSRKHGNSRNQWEEWIFPKKHRSQSR